MQDSFTKLKIRCEQYTPWHSIAAAYERLLQQHANDEGYFKQIRNGSFEEVSHRNSMKAIISEQEAVNPEFE